jgi:membrane protein insertase Oxa1/YidC/SpoIIIJ
MLLKVFHRKRIKIYQKKYITNEIFNSIPIFIQSYVSTIHSMTGLPWWATISASTVFVRMAMLPVVHFQMTQTLKLSGKNIIYILTS